MKLLLNKPELKKVIEDLPRKHFKTGTEVVHDNSYIKSIPIVEKGLLGVYKTDDEGREILLYYLTAGESCLVSFLSGLEHHKCSIKAVAEEDSEVILLPIEKAIEWLKTDSEWVIYILKLYHQRFEELLDVVNTVAFQKMDERLKNHLEKKAKLLNTKEISITHQHLAEELGTAREVVSRLLKQLEKSGFIEVKRNKITLL